MKAFSVIVETAAATVRLHRFGSTHSGAIAESHNEDHRSKYQGQAHHVGAEPDGTFTDLKAHYYVHQDKTVPAVAFVRTMAGDGRATTRWQTTTSPKEALAQWIVLPRPSPPWCLCHQGRGRDHRDGTPVASYP